jgi:hypothetical protein
MCGILRIVDTDSIVLEISTSLVVWVIIRLGSNVGSFLRVNNSELEAAFFFVRAELRLFMEQFDS